MLDAAFQIDTGTRKHPVSLRSNEQLRDQLTPPVQFDTVTSVSGFRALADEWASLTEDCASRVSVFQSFSWLRHWVDTYVSARGSSRQIAIVVGRTTDGRLVMIAPLQLERHGIVSQLCWMGCPISQYGDVLAASGHDTRDNIRAAISVAVRVFNPDVVSLCKVRNDSHVAKALSDGWAHALHQDTAYELVFREADSFPDYEKRYSSKSRKNRRRLLRRLREKHAVAFQLHSPGEEAAAVAKTGLELKRAWLRERGLLSTALHQEAMDKLVSSLADDPSSGCKIFSMTCDNRIVGVQIGFHHQGRLELYLIVYDMDFEKAGVGSLLLEATVRQTCDQGCAGVDLLAPDATYKREWADCSMSVRDYAKPFSILGRVYIAMYLIGARKLIKGAQAWLPLSWRKALFHFLR